MRKPSGVWRANVTVITSDGKVYVTVPRLYPNRNVGPCLCADSTILTTGTPVLIGFLEGNPTAPVVLSTFGSNIGALVGGGVQAPTPAVLTAATTWMPQQTILTFNTTGGAVAQPLPAAATMVVGRRYVAFKKTGAPALTVTGAVGGTVTVALNAAAGFVTDGTSWVSV